MKKLALTSLLAVFAVGGAHAANIYDGNPLYRPGEGKFYNMTTLASHSEFTDSWRLGTEFGYGITNELAVIVGTSMSELDGFDIMSWDDFSLGLNYRVLNETNWKADVYGTYALGGNPLVGGLGGVWGDHASFLAEANTFYTWTLGVRAGYVDNDFTIAGHVEYNYMGDESFNWGDTGLRAMSLGLDGIYVLDMNWSLIAGAEYTGILSDGFEDAGTATGYIGANYNFNSTTFLGLALTKDMANSADGWEFDEGFGFGARFGIQF